jgi:hypothetical protein
MDIDYLIQALNALKLQARAVQEGDREMLKEAQTAMENLKPHTFTVVSFLRNDPNITIDTANNEWLKSMIATK